MAGTPFPPPPLRCMPPFFIARRRQQCRLWSFFHIHVLKQRRRLKLASKKVKYVVFQIFFRERLSAERVVLHTLGAASNIFHAQDQQSAVSRGGEGVLTSWVLLRPKSIIFSLHPSWDDCRSRFSGFKSLCVTSCSWRYSMPSTFIVRDNFRCGVRERGRCV